MFPSCFAYRWSTALLAISVAASWNAPAIGQPGPHHSHTAVYDSPRQRMVMFGGTDGAAALYNDVWQLSLADSPAWVPLTPAGPLPQARMRHSAIYDPVGDRMLVFGGLGKNGSQLVVLADTVWALSLSGPPAWTALQPSGSGPSARFFHSAIYDPVRDRMVVYGGGTLSGSPFSEVWSLWLEPTPRWEQLLVAAPVALMRDHHSAIYDPVGDRMVIFSGAGFGLNTVWALSLGGTPAWTQLRPSGEAALPQLSGHSAIHDPVGNRMIVFGGSDGNQPRSEVWELALAGPPAWSPASGLGEGPSSRDSHSAVYDSVYRRMVVFGGSPVSSVEDEIRDISSRPTWALSVGPAMRWGPSTPKIEASPAELRLSPVTLGDTTSVTFTVSNLGLEPLRVDSLVHLPAPGIQLSSPPPFDLLWSKTRPETLTLAASVPDSLRDSLVFASTDPDNPRMQVIVSLQVRGLEFDTRILGDRPVPLGTSFGVVATPKSGVHVENGTLFYRIADGASAFDSLALTLLSTDFIATVPAAAVTEHGVEYYVRVENSGFVATRPRGAPAVLDTQAVRPPASISALPRPTSGLDYLSGREIPVEVLLPAGAIFVAGSLHSRRGGEPGWSSDTLAMNRVLGRPVAIIDSSLVGPRGVEYWVEVRTLDAALRFPAAEGVSAVIPVKLQTLAEQIEHPGLRYRLLSVPLDFGADYQLDAMLTDQFDRYDPVRWRAFAYDPDSLRNLELSTHPEWFRLEPGRAFWLISRAAHRVDSYPIPGFSTPTDREYPVALRPGWNQFGNPFDFPVAWSDVRRDPLAVGDSDLVAWDPSRGTAGGYIDPPAVLAPFEGYFVFSHSTATTLWVSPREALDASLAPEAGPGTTSADAGAGSRDLWRFGLEARSSDAIDDFNAFGVHAEAVDGWDPLDRLEPPPSPGPSVQVAFVHPDWAERSGHYRRDLRGPGTGGETWEIEVRSAVAGEPVTLDLSAIVAPPSDLAVGLIDREQGTSAGAASATGSPIRSGEPTADGAPSALRYQLVSFGPRPYRLAIAAGTKEYVESAVRQALSVPSRVTLDQNAPNPFALATRFRFGLPRAGRASLEIFDVRGARVATLLDGAELAPGYHSFIWDGMTTGGAARSGVYLLRLATGGGVMTRRIVLVR